jgi:type II secretory pathway component PulF
LKAKEKAIFFQQLAAMLNSGLTVQHCLTMAVKDRNSSFGRYLQKASAAVGSGMDLASAIALQPNYFDAWTIGLIRAAEYSGTLPEVCRRIAIASETEQRRERLYLSVRLAAIAIIWSILLLIAAIFKKQTSGLLKPGFWIYALGLGLVLFFASLIPSRYPSRGLHQLATKLPVLGKVIEARSLLYLADLALPLSAGIPILTALELLRSHIRDPQMGENIAKASRQIRNGRTLTESLQSKIPPVAIQIIRTGEETGNLDDAFQRLAVYYEGELERSLLQLQSILRPVSLLTVAALIVALGVRLITSFMNSLPG